MCLAIPGRIESIEGTDLLTRTATVEFEGERRTVRLLYLPEALIGDYVLVQAGYATSRVPPQEALDALALARRTTFSAPAAASGA
jgi:hydrogenase expression/formation protein HypC